MENNIGALWLRESQKGNKFMSGVIIIDGKKHQIVVFKNNYKQEEKHPDYRIFPSQPKEAQGAKDDFQDDIPF